MGADPIAVGDTVGRLARSVTAAATLTACVLGLIECAGALPARAPAPMTDPAPSWVLTSLDQQTAQRHQIPARLVSPGASLTFDTMAPDDDVARWLGPEDAALYRATSHHDGWTRYALEAPSGRPLFATASVEITQDGKRRPCPREGAKRRCMPDSWAYVGPTEIRVQGTDQPCIWSHPIDRATLHVTYPGVSIARGQSLTLRTALRDSAVSGKGAPITIAVALPSPERRPVRHTHRDRRGWQELTLQGPIEGDVSLAISTTHAGRRHLCHALEVTP